MTKTESGKPAVSLEERAMTYEELVARKGDLAADELLLGLRDGRELVRANAALGLAAIGHTGPDLIPFLRDAEPHAAKAAGDALAHLGKAQRAHLERIAAALDGARPEVVGSIVRMFAELVGHADAELVNVLDTTEPTAASTVVEACERVGLRGLQLLQKAAADERARVRFNAVKGVGRLAELEPPSSIQILRDIADHDGTSDVRAAARSAIAGFIARLRGAAAAARKMGEPVPLAVPAMFERALTADELRAAAGAAPAEELLGALLDERAVVRLNAVRVLALQGAAAAPCAPALATAARDADGTIRLESVKALGALAAAVAAAGGARGDDLAAPDPAVAVAAAALVGALGDVEGGVRDAAEQAIAGLGAAAAPALGERLDVANEAHGARIAALIAKLPDGIERLRDALASTSVDERANAAIGLGALGPRATAAVSALAATARDKNARVRGAALRAMAAIDPRPDRTPPPIAIDGFEERLLDEAALTKGKSALAAAGLAGLAPRFADARPHVRANTAAALGVLGDGPGVAAALAVCLRDDDAEVRAAAVRALARLGEPAIAASATELVRALRDADPPLAALLTATLKPRASIADALVRGLETDDARAVQRLNDLVIARADGVDLLCEAFARPRAQAAAARGFVLLGKDRLGKGRAALERARAEGTPRVRELARATLAAIDGPPAGPQPPSVPGFETELLDRAVFAKSGLLDAVSLLGFLPDGRPVVRANAATALGVLGPAAAAAAPTIAALLRDDDDRVRVAAARALDHLGDEAVVAVAPTLVGGLGGSAALADACRTVLAPRGAKVEAALVAGLDTSDETHGLRVAELVAALPGARELLFAAFDGEAHNVQINAAFGIAKLGKKAGADGRRRLLSGLPGPPTRRRAAMVKALSMLDGAPR